ncbi:DNA-binding protein [Brenneria alni]|uniref:DNA-binding protein n=1 Tax=Brenneria alni TaxID=71656 RepID=A0A421DPB7_9GAMM|nr:YafY family protein [Brenneria alni]RLM24476.1 DNA-binding protein [Brenneria alni]
MSRAQRLLDLLQILRGHRFPVTGSSLASELNISLRTLYRDIRTLQEQGAVIDGEPGLGYVLRPGYVIPPLMFSREEIEALVLGMRWVADRGDVSLQAAAKSALTKISAVIPDELHRTLDTTTLLVGPGACTQHKGEALPQIRQAIRTEHKLTINYCNLGGAVSIRTIWPFALGYFDHTRILVAWCELRQGFRHFRTDRISSLQILEQCYPRRRQMLLKEWQEIEKIPSQ